MPSPAENLQRQEKSADSPAYRESAGIRFPDKCTIDQLIRINSDQLVCALLPDLLHEANNELAVLQGSGELLLRSKAAVMPEQLERRSQSILRASARLTMLCHLLERNPAGNLSSSSCELTTLFQSVRSELTMLNDFDRVGWRLEPSEPLSVECPGWVMKQVIMNLVSNSLASIAIQGGTGEIFTQFTSSETEASFHWRDSGAGFQAALLSQIGREVLPSTTNHLGIGLFIVAQLLDRQGGRLDCQNGPGGMVTVTVPLSNPG